LAPVQGGIGSCIRQALSPRWRRLACTAWIGRPPAGEMESEGQAGRTADADAVAALG